MSSIRIVKLLPTRNGVIKSSIHSSSSSHSHSPPPVHSNQVCQLRSRTRINQCLLPPTSTPSPSGLLRRHHLRCSDPLPLARTLLHSDESHRHVRVDEDAVVSVACNQRKN